MAELEVDKLKEAMHIEARRLIAGYSAGGYKIDKAVCRFNDMMDTAIRYGLCGAPFNEKAAWGGLDEVVQSCVVGNALNTGKSCVSLVPDWMVPGTHDYEMCLAHGMAKANWPVCEAAT